MRMIILLAMIPGTCTGFQSSSEEIATRTFFFPFPEKQGIVIDNIAGSIKVVPSTTDSVELTAIRRTTADSEEEIRRASEEVRLEVGEKGNRLEIVVDAPWRDGRGRWGQGNSCDHDERGYEVAYEFTVKVPEHADVFLRTITRGDIEVTGVRGDFDIRSVTGDIILTDVSGSGRASTVSGLVEVRFRTNPSGECFFRTVNGEINAFFQEPLDADILLKTLNGKAYTGFDVLPVAEPVPVVRKRDGKTIYRFGDYSRVRAGRGGPSIRFETLNGDIAILKDQGSALN